MYPNLRGERLGLSVDGLGFKKGGAEFRGIGVNHWGSFINEVSSLGVSSDYLIDLAVIKQTYGLPFVRVAVGMYNAETWYNDWYLNKTAFYAKLDAYVAECERLDLGIVAVLVWGLKDFCRITYDVYGGYSPPSELAYKHTKSWQLFSEFVTEVITRYKDSPSIWAWEIGNEVANSIGVEFHSSWALDGTYASFLNWGTRPGGGIHKPSDKMSAAQWQVFSTNFVDLVNKIDPHRRVILAGSPIGNSFAVNAQSTSTLTADTLAQWSGVATTENLPWICYRDKAYNTITQHIYPQSLVNGRFFNGAEKSQAEMILLSKGWADSVGKPFFLGEFGATYHGDAVDEISTNLSEEAANFNAALNAIVTGGIKLSALWNYGGDLTGASPWMRWHLTPANRLYQLEAIALANAGMSL